MKNKLKNMNEWVPVLQATGLSLGVTGQSRFIDEVNLNHYIDFYNVHNSYRFHHIDFTNEEIVIHTMKKFPFVVDQFIYSMPVKSDFMPSTFCTHIIGVAKHPESSENIYVSYASQRSVRHISYFGDLRVYSHRTIVTLVGNISEDLPPESKKFEIERAIRELNRSSPCTHRMNAWDPFNARKDEVYTILARIWQLLMVS